MYSQSEEVNINGKQEILEAYLLLLRYIFVCVRRTSIRELPRFLDLGM
jgi:hypothetical protein